MKQKFTKLVCLAFCLILCENVTAQQTMLAIDNQSPGWLSSKIGYGDQQTVENLKVTGYLNGTDLQFIQGLKNDHKLLFLDLTDAVIVAGGSDYQTEANVFSCNCLSGSKKLRRIDTPRSAETKISPIADTIISNGTETSYSLIQLTPNSKVTRTPEPYYKYIQFGMNTEYVSFYPGTYYSNLYADGCTYYTGTLVLPHTIKTISGLYLDGGTIISYLDNPSNVDFQGGDIKNGIIYIPQGTMEVYSSSGFSKMKIVEMAPPTEIQLNKQQAKLFIDNSITLQANLVPEDAFYKEIKWESSNESVATVNQYGEISAVSSGTADIIVSSVKNPEVKAICTVSVYEHTSGVNISDENIVVSINETKQLTANTLPLGTSDNQIIWSSDNAEIASIDELGNVKGLQTGHCVIKATSVDGGFEAQCNVTVVQPAETITLNKESTSLIVGKTETLTANILPDNTTDKTILWSSSNINVATVDANGMITAKKAGECTITATSLSNPNVTATCKVTIIQPVTGITLNKNTIEMSELGEQNQLVATISPEDATNKSVTWNSSNNQICTVSATGIVTATGAGTTIVTATTVDGGLTANCVVKVLQHVDGLTLNKTATSLKVGESEKLQPTITPSNADNKKVIWTSSDSNVATVDTEGNVTAVKAGQVTITATSEDNAEIKATCAVTVIQPVTGISLSESSYKLKAIGENIQLTATVLPNDATNKKVNWNCPNNTVCIVSNGNVVAVGYGTAVIIATTEDGGFVATCTITVEDTSGIIEVKSDHNDNLPTYDTMGRKVQELKKGQLYIRQGKKFVVK